MHNLGPNDLFFDVPKVPPLAQKGQVSSGIKPEPAGLGILRSLERALKFDAYNEVINIIEGLVGVTLKRTVGGFEFSDRPERGGVFEIERSLGRGKKRTVGEGEESREELIHDSAIQDTAGSRFFWALYNANQVSDEWLQGLGASLYTSHDFLGAIMASIRMTEHLFLKGADNDPDMLMALNSTKAIALANIFVDKYWTEKKLKDKADLAYNSEKISLSRGRFVKVLAAALATAFNHAGYEHASKSISEVREDDQLKVFLETYEEQEAALCFDEMDGNKRDEKIPRMVQFVKAHYYSNLLNPNEVQRMWIKYAAEAESASDACYQIQRELYQRCLEAKKFLLLCGKNLSKDNASFIQRSLELGMRFYLIARDGKFNGEEFKKLSERINNIAVRSLKDVELEESYNFEDQAAPSVEASDIIRQILSVEGDKVDEGVKLLTQSLRQYRKLLGHSPGTEKEYGISIKVLTDNQDDMLKFFRIGAIAHSAILKEANRFTTELIRWRDNSPDFVSGLAARLQVSPDFPVFIKLESDVHTLWEASLSHIRGES